jgi:hypothetical protein
MALLFLTSALDGGELSAGSPCCFTPGETASGTHCIGGWMGPRNRLDVMEKRNLLFLPGIKPQLLSHLAHSLVTIPTELSIFCAFINSVNRYDKWVVAKWFSNYEIQYNPFCSVIVRDLEKHTGHKMCSFFSTCYLKHFLFQQIFSGRNMSPSV